MTKHYVVRIVVTEVSEAQPAKLNRYGNVETKATQRATRNIYESTAATATLHDAAQVMKTTASSYNQILKDRAK